MNKENILNNIQENIAIEKFRTIHKRQEKTKKILQSTLTVVICCLSVTGIVFIPKFINMKYIVMVIAINRFLNISFLIFLFF